MVVPNKPENNRSCDLLFITVRDAIDGGKLLPPGGGITAGVSGGYDSACLLHILSSYLNSAAPPLSAGERRERLVAVHVNHMLRGEESLRDEEHTARLCAVLGVRLIVVREDIQAYASKTRMSVEAAGREVRYNALERARASQEAETGRPWRVAVAHNRDDLAETVLMNILRGAGVDGLRGMSPGAPNTYVVRPLLGVNRLQIEAYLKRNGVEAVFDSTNDDISYMRNRIRAELLPALRNNYNPGVVDALCRLSEAAGRDGDYLTLEAERAYKHCLLADGADPLRVVLSLEIFNALHPAIASRVLRVAIANAGADIRRVGHVHITGVLALAASGRTGSTLQLPGGLRVRRSYGSLAFFLDTPTPARAPTPQPASAPAPTPPGVVTKSLHFIDDEIVEQIRNIRYNSLEQFFDADVLLADELVLRYRRNGDLFYPINSPGPKKLKEYFIDAKIPAEYRDSVCLLAAGDEVAWVIGHRVSERYKVTGRTQNVLRAIYKPYNI